MTIYDLINITRKYGRWDGNGNVCIGGCEVLEHIVDVEGFVSLLREFNRRDTVNLRIVGFVEDYPEPVGVILGGGVTVWYGYGSSRDCIQVNITNSRYYYWHGGIFS